MLTHLTLSDCVLDYKFKTRTHIKVLHLQSTHIKIIIGVHIIRGTEMMKSQLIVCFVT